MIRRAKYHSIPCTFDDETSELIGKNWFWDQLVSLNVWLDQNVFMVSEFEIWVEYSEEEIENMKKNK